MIFNRLLRLCLWTARWVANVPATALCLPLGFSVMLLEWACAKLDRRASLNPSYWPRKMPESWLQKKAEREVSDVGRN